jgi:argininosuccinate lyase
MPFRQAHELVGSLVRDSVQRGVPLAELVHTHPSLGEEAVGLLEPGVAVTRRTSPGGAGPGPLSVQLEHFRQRMSVDSQRIAYVKDRQDRSRASTARESG